MTTGAEDPIPRVNFLSSYDKVSINLDFDKGMNLSEIVEALIKDILSIYANFDDKWRQKNPGKSSYHNPYHVEAAINAATLLVEAALKANDPAGILQELKNYNEIYKNLGIAEIRKEELLPYIRLAFAVHDLGNIATLGGDRSGMLELIMSEGYASTGAEIRSQLIAAAIIKNTAFPNKQQRGAMLFFILDLIHASIVDTSQNFPFSRFIKLVDQVGGNLLNKQPDYGKGLDDEEGKPVYKVDFPHAKLQELYPDENARKGILKIWGINTT